MFERFSALWFAALLAVVGALALINTSLTGDGYEYMLTMHALYQHGSFAITEDDVASLQRTAGSMPFYGATLGDLMPFIGAHLRAPDATPPFTFTIMPNAAGHFYGIHFGLYPLLALPFYALLQALGVDPYYAFTLLNLGCCAAACLYLRRALPERAGLAMLLFLLAGTTFYLNWTGPEVMTASCVLVACVALLRGQAGLAILLAGLAASQNPPLMLLMPAAVAFRMLCARYPALQWPGSAPAATGRREIGLALAGCVLAVAPYAFFQLVFGTPSVIARDFNAPEFATGARLFSLLFDLNQGMFMGCAGVGLALVVALFSVPRPQRAGWLAVAALVVAAVLVMAVPTLTAINWNSGGVVMTRYSYWLCMPLLALVFYAVRLAPPWPGKAVLLGGVALQALLLMSTGLLGGKTSYLEHSTPARWVLAHAPTLYNPEAEIFHARNGQVVTLPLPPETISVFAHAGVPTKILRHRGNRAAPPGLCPAGATLDGHDVRPVTREWEYLHAPFTCVSARTSSGD